MKDELERIATALESIAASLIKKANPPIAVEPEFDADGWRIQRGFLDDGTSYVMRIKEGHLVGYDSAREPGTWRDPETSDLTKRIFCNPSGSCSRCAPNIRDLPARQVLDALQRAANHTATCPFRRAFGHPDLLSPDGRLAPVGGLRESGPA